MDSVSLPTRNLRVSIPLIHLKGRGLDFDVAATFNTVTFSTAQTSVPNVNQFYETTAAGGGWGIGVNHMGVINHSTSRCTSFDPQGICQGWAYYAVFDTSDGSSLQLGQDTPANTTPVRFWSSDGTYMRIPSFSGSLVTGPFIVPKLVYKDGTTLNQHYTAQNTNDFSTLEDTNGNQIKCVWGAPQNTATPIPSSCTDTVGRVVTFNYNASGLNSITYLDSSGVQQSITFSWSTQGVNLPWADSGQNNDPNCSPNGWTCYHVDYSIPMPLLHQITLPNGRSYTFDYLTSPDGSTPGQISKVTLPTGGYIRYVYPCSAGCAYPFVSLSPGQEPWAPVTARVVSTDGTSGTEQTWSYQEVISGGTSSYTVTDPVGNAQTSYFQWDYDCPVAPTQTDFKKPNGGIVKQIFNTIGSDNTGYTDPFPGPFIGPFCNNTRVTQTKIVLSDTNQQSSKTISYGSFGNVTDEYDYDWGAGAPGSLLRHKKQTYLHDSNTAYGDLAAHILDRVTSSSVYGPDDATLLSQATTGYDSPVPTSTTGIIQHDYSGYPATNTVRGNATQTSHWVNTNSSWVTITNVFNDVGNLIQTTNPLGSITTFGYTDNYRGGTPVQPTSAFATQINRPPTNGVNHIQRFQYYLNTGLIAAKCGENFPSATACAFGLTGSQPDYESDTYDWEGRLLTSAVGDGGQTTVTYNEAALPISIGVRTKQDTNTAHDVTQTKVYDGLGRLSQTQLTSDPSGTTYQLTTYDPAGRRSQTFNMTRCNPPGSNCGESTWGYASFTYDSLDRVTVATSQDGGISKTQFIGNITVVTDPVGKQRQSVADALGRIVEVDEPGAQPPVQSNYATMQTDGNFVLYNSSNSALWSTGTGGTNASSIFMQDDGNWVLYVFKWSAGVYAASSPGPFPPSSCSIGTYLVAGQFLPSGKCIVSPHGQYFLLMNTDGNLFIYDWAHGTGTWGPGTQGHPGAYAVFQTYGNLVVYDVNGTPLWDSGTGGTYAERLDMNDDGRLIIWKSAWNSGTSNGQFNWTQLSHPSCDVGIGTGWTGVLGAGSCFVSPNGHFELLLQTDGNLVLNDLGSTPANMLWSTNTGVTALSPGYSLVTKYFYDGMDNLTCVEQHGTDPNGTGCAAPASSDANSTWRVRRFTYDSLARPVNTSSPEANTGSNGSSFVRVNTSYVYDANGNLLQKTSPAVNQQGTATQTISYCYDALNRVTGKKYAAQSCPLTSPIASYSYDQTSFNGLTISNGIGRRTGMTDQAGSEAWSYDVAGRTAADRRSIGSVTKTTSYTYNFLGNPTSVVYPSTRTISYTYNNAGQPISAADTPNSITYASAALYSPNGMFTSLKNGANLTSTFYYNDRLQLCRSYVTTGTGSPANCADLGTIGNIIDITYGYSLATGDNGNVISINNNRDTARNQTFSYDTLNRISTAQTSSTTGTKCFGETFGYDAWGNVLTIGGLTGYTGCTQENLGVASNVKNQISTNAYDSAGNTTPSGYSFDAENHLLAAGGVTYTYDGDGRRVKKSSGTLYWYGMTPSALDETDLTGSATNSAFNEYIFFQGKRIARRNSSNTVFYYFTDRIGTGRVIVQAGQTSACYDADYYPFGGERTPIINSCAQHYKFTGKERDSESGLDNFAARFYASFNGRFASPDPDQQSGFSHLVDPQAWNGYAYARNNPLNFVDPDGKDYRVCDNEERNCVILTDDEFKEFLKEAPNVHQTGESLYYSAPGVDPQKIGTAEYVSPGYLDAAAMIGSGEDFVAEFAKQAVIAGVTGGAANEVINGVRAGLGIAEETGLISLNIGRIVVGQIIDVTIQTAAGAVRVYAEVIAVEGKTVTLSVAIYPLEGEVLNVGVKEMLQGVRPILQKLADKGVEEVIITAKRLSGANPGRDLYLRIKLK